MSLVPLTTQFGSDYQSSATPDSDSKGINVIIYRGSRETPKQAELLKLCHNKLASLLPVKSCEKATIKRNAKNVQCIVVPKADDKSRWISEIRAHFEKPTIMVPRAALELCSQLNPKLPRRHLTRSLTMSRCLVFLSKGINDNQEIRRMINEMSGKIVSDIRTQYNIHVTDVTNNKSCQNSFKSALPIVSKDWIEDNYQDTIVNDEDVDKFNIDALDERIVNKYRIKLFYGLSFVLNIKDKIKLKALQEMIKENQGTVVYGEKKLHSHLYTVCETFEDMVKLNSSSNSRIVDIGYLDSCLQNGYIESRNVYITNKQNKQINNTLKCQEQNTKIESNNHIDTATQEMLVNTHQSTQQQNMIDPNESCENTNENLKMTPQTIVCQNRQQPEHMNEMILKALAFDVPQTQLASTQMRRLPDSELRIEQTYEPTQQLFWNDCSSRS